MERVEAWKTADGKLFPIEQEEQAKRHDVEAKTEVGRDKFELIDIIQTLNESETEFEMVTDDGTEVTMVNGEYNINIYDMFGKVVLNTFFVDNKSLDVTSLDNGSYIIHLYNSEVNLKRNLIKQ